MLGFSKRFISLNEADGGIKMISLCNSWIANYRNYCFNLRFPLCGFKALPSLNHKKFKCFFTEANLLKIIHR